MKAFCICMGYILCVSMGVGEVCSYVIFSSNFIYDMTSVCFECRDQMQKLPMNSSELMGYWMQLFGT